MVVSSAIIDHASHIVYIPNPQGGILYKQYGYSKKSKDSVNEYDDNDETQHGLYISPEEALYLLEKGLLDIINDSPLNSMELLFSWITNPKSYKVYKYLKDLDYLVFSLKHPFSIKLLHSLSTQDYTTIPWFDFIVYQPNSKFKKSNPSEPPFCFIHLVLDCNEPFVNNAVHPIQQFLALHFPTSKYINAVILDEEIIFLSQTHDNSLLE